MESCGILWNLVESCGILWNLVSHDSGSKDIVWGPKESLSAPFGVSPALLNRGTVNVLAVVLNLAHGRLIGKGAK